MTEPSIKGVTVGSQIQEKDTAKAPQQSKQQQPRLQGQMKPLPSTEMSSEIVFSNTEVQEIENERERSHCVENEPLDAELLPSSLSDEAVSRPEDPFLSLKKAYESHYGIVREEKREQTQIETEAEPVILEPISVCHLDSLYISPSSASSPKLTETKSKTSISASAASEKHEKFAPFSLSSLWAAFSCDYSAKILSDTEYNVLEAQKKTRECPFDSKGLLFSSLSSALQERQLLLQHSNETLSLMCSPASIVEIASSSALETNNSIDFIMKQANRMSSQSVNHQTMLIQSSTTVPSAAASTASSVSPSEPKIALSSDKCHLFTLLNCGLNRFFSSLASSRDFLKNEIAPKMKERDGLLLSIASVYCSDESSQEQMEELAPNSPWSSFFTWLNEHRHHHLHRFPWNPAHFSVQSSLVPGGSEHDKKLILSVIARENQKVFIDLNQDKKEFEVAKGNHIELDYRWMLKSSDGHQVNLNQLLEGSGLRVLRVWSIPKSKQEIVRKTVETSCDVVEKKPAEITVSMVMLVRSLTRRD